jgi:hypothetical protein
MRRREGAGQNKESRLYEMMEDFLQEPFWWRWRRIPKLKWNRLYRVVDKSWRQPDAEDRGISCHSSRKYSDITLIFFKWYQTKSFGFRDKEEIM